MFSKVEQVSESIEIYR